MASLTASSAVGLSETFSKLKEQGKVKISYHLLSPALFLTFHFWVVCLFVAFWSSLFDVVESPHINSILINASLLLAKPSNWIPVLVITINT